MTTETPTLIWKISDLERETADGFVYMAHYTVDLDDGTYRAGAYGSIGFDRPEALIPYADLTQEQVASWVQAGLGQKKVLELTQALQNQLAEQHQPTKAKGVPWD